MFIIINPISKKHYSTWNIWFAFDGLLPKSGFGLGFLNSNMDALKFVFAAVNEEHILVYGELLTDGSSQYSLVGFCLYVYQYCKKKIEK